MPLSVVDFAIHQVAPQDREALARCHPVALELRPQFTEVADFIHAARQSQEHGLIFAYLEHKGIVRSFAGFRICRNLHSGTHMYVDDLVTRAQDHGAGYGSTLFDWLVALARQHGCTQFHLDSGVHRFDAHRFYLH